MSSTKTQSHQHGDGHSEDDQHSGEQLDEDHKSGGNGAARTSQHDGSAVLARAIAVDPDLAELCALYFDMLRPKTLRPPSPHSW